METQEAPGNVGEVTAWVSVLVKDLPERADGEGARKHKYDLVTTLALLP